MNESNNLPSRNHVSEENSNYINGNIPANLSFSSETISSATRRLGTLEANLANANDRIANLDLTVTGLRNTVTGLGILVLD